MRSWSGLFYWFASNPNMNLKFVYKFWEENVLAMILPVLTFWYFYLFHFYPPPKKEAIQQTKTRTNSTVVEKLHNSLKSSPKCIGNSAEFIARATSYAYLSKMVAWVFTVQFCTFLLFCAFVLLLLVTVSFQTGKNVFLAIILPSNICIEECWNSQQKVRKEIFRSVSKADPDDKKIVSKGV